MNRCTDGVTAQALGDRDRDDQQHEADRQQPEQVEPPAATDAHARGDAVDLRDRARPGGGVDDVLARRQLLPVAANDVRRDTRPLICRQILRRGVGIGVHSRQPTPSSTNAKEPDPLTTWRLMVRRSHRASVTFAQPNPGNQSRSGPKRKTVPLLATSKLRRGLITGRRTFFFAARGRRIGHRREVRIVRLWAAGRRLRRLALHPDGRAGVAAGDVGDSAGDRRVPIRRH